MGEPRDFQMLIGLAKRKYNNDEKAIDLMKKIAANQSGVPQRTFAAGGVFGVRAAPCLFHLLCAPFSAAHEEGAPIQPAAHRRRG